MLAIGGNFALICLIIITFSFCSNPAHGASYPVASVKVGVLHSLTGALSIAESPIVDATLYAINAINRNGGLLGKQILPVILNGASNPVTFAQQAKTLLADSTVVAAFGGFSAASRVAMIPAFEASNIQLWHPAPHVEGQGEAEI